ncbi:MAG: hypothetical protein R2746_08565 [Acidimicrobiales bacterium]
MDGPAAADGGLLMIASHQDQVVELPDGAEVIARTDHRPVAAFTVGPRALAIQPHPEFSADVSCPHRPAPRHDRRGAQRRRPRHPRRPPRPRPPPGGHLDANFWRQ